VEGEGVEGGGGGVRVGVRVEGEGKDAGAGEGEGESELQQRHPPASHGTRRARQAFIAVSTEVPQLDQTYVHERVRAYATPMQASTLYWNVVM